MSADFAAFMTDALDLAHPPAEGVKAMFHAYLTYWRKHPCAFRFNQWRQMAGPADEWQARSELMARNGVVFMQMAQKAGFIRKDVPPGLALIFGGSAIQFWLHSQIEVRDALSISGGAKLSEDAFLEHILRLLRAA